MLPAVALIVLSIGSALADEKPISAEGFVIDRAGKPRPDAEVFLAETQTGLGIRPLLLERVRADPRGLFRVSLPAGPVDSALRDKPWALWAYSPGLGVASVLVPRTWPVGGEPFRLQLPAAARLAVQVLGPDGKPAANVRVAAAAALNRIVPEALAEMLAATTDKDGGATLIGFSAEDLTLVRLVSAITGTQHVALPRPDSAGTRTLTLRPVGRIEGRITAADRKAAQGLKIHATSRLDASDPAGVGGSADCTTGADGRFVIPVLAEGTATLRFVPHLDLPFRGSFDAQPEVAPGQSTTVELLLKRAVLVKGVVQEQRTGKPIAGALVRLDWNEVIPRVCTDAQGHYAGYVEKSWLVPYVSGLPRAFIHTEAAIGTQSVPNQAPEFTCKPILLAAGANLRGLVVDENGKPVAGAKVTGAWKSPEGDSWSVTTWTVRDGTFLLEDVDGKAEVQLSAEFKGRSTARPVAAHPDARQPVTIRISTAHAVALTGRVVDPAGRPLAGIAIQILAGDREPRRRAFQAQVIDFDGRDTVLTDADGRFRTPRQLHPDPVYRARVDSPGFVIALTEWLEPEHHPAGAFANLVLFPAPRLRTVSGQIVDRRGRPVPGAVVFQSGDGPRRTRTTADDQGRFHLQGIHEGRAFLFVEHADFRFRGHAVDVADKPVQLTLDRKKEPVVSLLKPLPPLLSRQEERALGRRLVDPALRRVFGTAWDPAVTGAGVPFNGEVATREQHLLLEIGPLLDPGWGLEFADRGILEEKRGDRVRLHAVKGLLEESPDEAMAIAESIKTPYYRVSAYLSASDRTAVDNVTRKRELLEAAQLYARAEPIPHKKLDEFEQICWRWLELGERDRATQLLREGQVIAEGFPAPTLPLRRTDGALSRAYFAAKLARIDTKAALALADGWTDETYHDWFVGGVALGTAEHDPGEAVRILGMLRSDSGRNHRLARVCGRIAVKDFKKARELAGQLLETKDRLAALANMARALARADPDSARSLIEEAYTIYENMVRTGAATTGGYFSTCVQASGLLLIAEQIDREFLEDCFWRTLALRPNRPGRGEPQLDLRRSHEPALCQLAIMLARYDRGVARTVLEPVALRARALVDGELELAAGPLFTAAALIDPQWAVQLINALPDDASGAKVRPKDEARQVVARLLANGGARKWDYVLEMIHLDGDSKDDER